MRQYLIEGVTGAVPFIVDRSKPPVTESQPDGKGSYTRIPGRLSVCDCVNGNNRRYAKRIWEKNLQTGSVLQDSIAKNAAFGLLEHPADGIVTLRSPISHHVTKASMAENRDVAGKIVHEVVGEIVILDTVDGNKLKALIEGGYNPLVSSRGYGSLEKGADGVDEVKDDYVCEGWDVVIKPSFETAELTPQRSTTTATMAAPATPNPQAESIVSEAAPRPGMTAICPQCRMPVRGDRGRSGSGAETAPWTCEVHGHVERPLWSQGIDATKRPPTPLERQWQQQAESQTLKESTPSSGAAKPTSETPNKNKIMELNELKTSINTLRNADPTKPHRFAESMSQVEELHQQVAIWAAADATRAWEATKLHQQLESLSTGFTKTIQQPVVESRRLTEQNTKLMRVINAVASTAVTYKKKLGESLKANGSRVKMIEELTRRGQGWQRIAESRKQKAAVLEKDFNTSCEALDLMAERYHSDVTELGRRLIVLEFKEKAQTPEIQKALKEACRLRHIVAIRETLEGKKPVAEADALKKPTEGEAPGKEGIKDDKQKGAGSPDEGSVAKAPGKVATESKTSATPPIPENRVIKSGRADLTVSSINESVELVQRLSQTPPVTK